MNKFLERIIEGVIVTDGSMQSVLSSMGFDETPIEIYNLKNPIIIEKIHFEFINAGAEIIQSNTLFGNTISLSQYKLDDRFYEINRKGVWLARTAAINKAFVAGVVGPVGKFLYPVGQLKPDIVSEAFTSQIHALLDGKCDIIMLKSFIDIDELELAYSAVRKISKDIAIIAQKSFPEDGSVLKTEYPKVIANKLYKEGVVAIGTNGTVGPQRMKEIVKSLYGVTNAILSAQPDIGIPTLIDNVASYNATSEYVAQSCKTLVENGVTIIGADGGCLPEHTKAISMAVKGLKVGKPEIIVKPSILKNNSTLDLELAKSKFQKNIGKKLLVSVELDVPRGLDLNSIFKGAEYLSKNEIDAVNISDGARARLRMSPITISHLVQNKTGMECISHFACRDRNMVGLQSELLSAYTLGVNNILSVTGDPAQI
ncbi:MAG: homocysteine S-methyltransferase family protein, partial [Candidatus Kapaibacterium sp.]